MANNKHYITLDGINKKEIPREALENVGQLFTFLNTEINTEADHIKALLAEGKTDFNNETIKFILTQSTLKKIINGKYWLDGKGGENKHLTEKVLNELKSYEFIDVETIGALLAVNAEGKEIYKRLESTKKNRNNDFTEAREWLAMPTSEELLKICEDMGKGWKLDKPPLYGLLIICAMQAYTNYKIFGEGFRADQEFIKEYEELKAIREATKQQNRDPEEKINLLIEYFGRTAEIENKNGIPASVSFTASKLSQVLRPTGEKIGKRKQGTAREEHIKRLEEIIIYLIEKYDLPISEQESISPQTGHAKKCWNIETAGTMEIFEGAENTGQPEALLMLPIREEIKNYVFIGKKWLNYEGLEDFLKNEQRITAYYYIVLKITEAQQAGQAEVNINLEELLKLCGYDRKDKTTQKNFINTAIIGDQDKPGICEILYNDIDFVDMRKEGEAAIKLIII